MVIQSENDFPALREKIRDWRKKFSMFRHDVDQIENIIESHIQNYSIALVYYRQTQKNFYLKQAQEEIDSINRVVSMAEKMELMAFLSR